MSGSEKREAGGPVGCGFWKEPEEGGSVQLTTR